MRNPSAFAWRSALALAIAAKEPDAARWLAQAELEDARTAGTQRGIGVALRALATLRSGEEAIELLRESANLLATSPARLEHARSLIQLGAALRRAGQRAQARETLREGLAIAQRSDAAPLAELAREKLAASGARLRHAHEGRNQLTPSERRVAQRAAEGATNPQIAQSLFLTVKTVEGHLSNTYRKLGINTRHELPRELASHPPRLD